MLIDAKSARAIYHYDGSERPKGNLRADKSTSWAWGDGFYETDLYRLASHARRQSRRTPMNTYRRFRHGPNKAHKLIAIGGGKGIQYDWGRFVTDYSR